MLFAHSHAWTRTQKWVIVTAAALGIAALTTAVCIYERRLSPLEAKLVGTWGFNSISGEVDYTYLADHKWSIAGDSPLNGRWWVEGDKLVSYLELPKEYADDPELVSLFKQKRERILGVTMKRLFLMKDGSKFEMLRMRCPRCDTKLGSFATYESSPTQRNSCPKCGFKLDDV